MQDEGLAEMRTLVWKVCGDECSVLLLYFYLFLVLSDLSTKSPHLNDAYVEHADNPFSSLGEC